MSIDEATVAGELGASGGASLGRLLDDDTLGIIFHDAT